MKRLIIIFCLLPSMFINAQVIDWNNFNEKTMNEVMFSEMHDYTKRNGCYSILRMSGEQQKINRFIKKNNEKLSLDDLSAVINNEVLTKYDTPSSFFVGILDSVSCKNIKEYSEIAIRCITDWDNSPSDAFFMIGWGKVAEVTSYYSKRSKTVYISCVFQN